MRPDELALLIAVARVVRKVIAPWKYYGPEREALDEAMKPFEPRADTEDEGRIVA